MNQVFSIRGGTFLFSQNWYTFTFPLTIAPFDKLEGRDVEIFKERDRKLETAREQRKQKRHKAYSENNFSESAVVH